MDANSKNTVTNTQEAFFRATTKTSVTIEAVDPVESKAEAVAPAVVAPVEDKTKTVAPQAEDKIQTTERTERNWLQTIGTILLALFGIVLTIALAWFLFNRLASPRNAVEPAPASAPMTSAPAPISQETWKAVPTSANSNGNFIGDMGGKGNGSVIPTQAVDLQGKTWDIGRVLLTYCEDASTCFYSYGKPGDKLSRAFNVNAYTPEFVGDLFNELQYVNTGWNNNANVTWTFVQ